jgi:hypothetical protein
MISCKSESGEPFGLGWLGYQKGPFAIRKDGDIGPQIAFTDGAKPMREGPIMGCVLPFGFSGQAPPVPGQPLRERLAGY